VWGYSYARPIIVRYVGDFLGLKVSNEPTVPPGVLNEAGLYKIITDYQHYLNYDHDETSTWKRRAAFLESMQTMIDFLHPPSVGIVRRVIGIVPYLAKSLWVGSDKTLLKKYLEKGGGDYVWKFGTKVSEDLKRQGKTPHQIQTIKFLMALEGAYNTVLMVCLHKLHLFIWCHN
jgi:hypothetical protein